MTPQLLKDIFKAFRIKTFTDFFPGIEAKVIQDWIEGKHPIPEDISGKLYHLHCIYKMVILDAINEAFDIPDKKAYWPTYLSDADFEKIDPEGYKLFSGSSWLQKMTIYDAEAAFSRLFLIEGYKPCSVYTYTLSAETYFNWLRSNGYSNTDARRKQCTNMLFQRHRPMRSDALHMLRNGESIPETDPDKTREIEDMMHEMRERLGLVPPPKVRTIPTPQEVWEGFLQSRSEVS